MKKIGMLLVGHGSKLPYNKELVESTASLISQNNSEFLVKPCFMSINKPSVQEKLEEFKAEDIELLIVVPLFLAKGVHINKDIPAVLGLSEGERKGSFTLNGKEIPLVYANPIGGDPLLAKLMVKNARQAIDDLL